MPESTFPIVMHVNMYTSLLFYRNRTRLYIWFHSLQRGVFENIKWHKQVEHSIICKNADAKLLTNKNRTCFDFFSPECPHEEDAVPIILLGTKLFTRFVEVTGKSHDLFLKWIAITSLEKRGPQWKMFSRTQSRI